MTPRTLETIKRMLGPRPQAAVDHMVLRSMATDLVAEVERSWALIGQAAEHLVPCPVPNIAEGYDLCSCGSSWPCAKTELAWRIKGLDPSQETARAINSVRLSLV
jgi:hypothetical protein